MNPLLDNDFLIKLNNDRNRTIYAHIISLNQQEEPIEQLEGIVTGGSISIDGASAVRRTCSLTVSAKNLNINNVYWGLSTKIKIELGIENHILGYEHYGKIIWFKQGTFILSDFKTTQTLNNYTINLSAKDKMCLLNGDVAGNIPAPTIFDSYTDRTGQKYTLQENDNGKYNNFLDKYAMTAIQEGFYGQYGDNYQNIQGVHKIIGLQYKPFDPSFTKEAFEGTIKFSFSQDEIALKNILSDAPNINGFYDINLDERTIQGFIVDNCNIGDTFSWEIEQKIPITIIIQELLHQYGQERYSNIIIKNIEPYALEMLDNDTDETMYLLYNGIEYCGMISKTTLINNYRLFVPTNTLDDENKIFVNNTGDIINFNFMSIVGEDNNSLISSIKNISQTSNTTYPTKIIKLGDDSVVYTVCPIEPGSAAGYGMTLLVYPDELKGDIGTSITSILDKIVNMLGNYEYFYNLDGQFVFQAKPAYYKPQYNNLMYLDDTGYVQPGELRETVAYTFDSANLTTQYQNSPQMNNIKNDYIIWGERQLNGNTVKFHGRYAIENPPLEYTDFNGYTWVSNKNQIFKEDTEDPKYTEENFMNINKVKRKYALGEEIVDWRQLLNIMADDWYQHHTEEDFEINLRQNNCWPNLNPAIDLYPYGKTGYEQFYLDMSSISGLWETLYMSTFIKYQYFNLHPDLLVINESDSEKEISQKKRNQAEFESLSKTYDYQLRKTEKYGIYDTLGSIKIILCDKAYDKNNNIYRLVITLNDENSYNLLAQELEELGSYVIDKNWEIENNFYLLICDIQGSLITDNYIKVDESGILKLIITNEKPSVITNNLSILYGKKAVRDYKSQYFDNNDYKYWNKNIINNPELLTFWFDFFKADERGIGKFATKVIGDRPKTINDTSIKTIIYRDTPDVIYCDWSEYYLYRKMMVLKDGYKYIILDKNNNGYDEKDVADLLLAYQELINLRESDIFTQEQEEKYLDKILNLGYNEQELAKLYNNFTTGVKQNSFIRSVRSKNVYEQAETMLSQYSYYNDTVTITSIPIYYLQPNTRISVKDDLSKIIGHYIMNKISLSLTYNGTMQITAIKPQERIY